MFNIYNFMLAGGFVVFALVDTVAPVRDYPAARWWRLRGMTSAALYLALASYAPYLWTDVMADATMFDASSLPLALSIAVGYAVMQLFHYLWHRALHHFEILWRVFHQMHHSAERLDIYGALYFHPLDMLASNPTESEQPDRARAVAVVLFFKKRRPKPKKERVC